MVPGTSVKSSKEALRLTRLYPGAIYSTAGMCELYFFLLSISLFTNHKLNHISGIHPHDSKSIVEEPDSWKEYESIANQPECVAIGPCGLDYQRDFSEPHVQKTIFEKQLQLAIQLGKPVLIHERSAHTDVLDTLKRLVCAFAGKRASTIDAKQFNRCNNIIFVCSSTRFPNITQIVIRGFMGTTEEAMAYLDRGYYLGFTGYLCKVNVPLNSMFRHSNYPIFHICFFFARINPIPAYENCSKVVSYHSNDFWLKVMHHSCIQIQEHRNCRNTLKRPPQNDRFCFCIGSVQTYHFMF